MDHHEIAGRFNARFACSDQTVLVGGALEPLYLPATSRRPAIIRYTRDYARSALHEIAHWCLAGTDRRCHVDYAMWYQPPPRSSAQQQRFYAAELQVQALELLLAEASGVDFRMSSDNPGADDSQACAEFETRVKRAAANLIVAGSGARAAAVLGALGVVPARGARPGACSG